MNRLKVLVYTIIAICIWGTLFTGGQVESLFEQMLILLVIFVLVVELVPQLIVGDEKKTSREAKPE
jgi:hypothetical protein